METVPVAPDDSAGANPSSVKSDDSSPRPDSRSGSPPPNCAICLGTCKNKSFTDSCLHQFCFTCLLTWSKVKAECPLCKQAFRSIIHNVRSNHQYEEYLVVQRENEELNNRIDIDRVTTATQRFRYRTTLTLPRRETIAIQQLLRHYPFMADVFPPPATRVEPARRRRSPASFRRTVYRHNLWARPLPDFTGRFRDCTPEFYRYNDTQMHRLVPWLNRELHYLLNENEGHISYVMTRILELLPRHHINSSEFREVMQRYFGERTEHFLHELYCFASTPYDITGYDRNVQYTTDTRFSTMVNEVISSTDSEGSADSDIVMVSSSEPAEPPAGPSRCPAPVYPVGYIPMPSTANTVIPIETIGSQSDSDDDDSEVMVVGYIKPPQERTPEIVDLLGSDSDVIVQDNPQPEPEPAIAPRMPSVKVTLKRHRTRVDSDSSDSSYRPPLRQRRRARRASASTSDTNRSTPSYTASNSSSHNPRVAENSETGENSWHSHSSPSALSTVSTSTKSSTTTARSSSCDDDSDDSQFVVKNKSKKKSNREATSSRDRRKSKKKSSRSHHKDKKNGQSSDKDKRSKKSYSGKGVKSSKKASNSSVTSEQTLPPSLDEPSTSGTSGTSTKEKRKSSKERKRQRRDSRENRRLRSVVNVMYNSHNKNTNGSKSSANHNNVSTTTTSRSEAESTVTTSSGSRVAEASSLNGYSELPSTSRRQTDSSSDSEDNLPLNLTLQKLGPHSSSL
ncbi:E3 ubiquitin-protein ligase Topors isoform X1 [Spodoptera frugiperda]|uniref:E3 ubiquitin-protein ligase Topors n=1 Tax=Spodoptera frugiperda TaxID=7108 RepID=A0A9R0D6C0_SPOFR|nr:E3 ubiquitin-protein ligase Topors isoform X1 [Spodoptera frugiperda]XP_035441602.1 E3 ubiquitin-protein ligase Topors isoform X1 [Spodoptera frugiperda]XP_035441612.1 E3 ubiquitin-protein ligase Topors isoform X1 [Spodoptera frugiperda]XP_035441623.1 E3 ubiquitin-protein ligase Topors isoform X1 [Spodoptera frugiperda]